MSDEDTGEIAADEPSDASSPLHSTGQPTGDVSEAQPSKNQAQEGDAEQDKSDDKDSEGGAPGAYDDFDVPQGVKLDEESLEEFQDVSKELNLSQDSAQKLVGQAIKLQQKWQDSLVQDYEKQQAEWVQNVKSDKEIGGGRFDEALTTAARARDLFATPELISELDRTGMGNHPEVIRFFYRVGKEVSEATSVRAGNPQGRSKTAADILYD